MAKKKGERKEQKAAESSELDLDGGYVCPVQSLKDLSGAAVISALAKSRYLQFLLAITVAGILLRFYDLGFNSLWLDEASTYQISGRTFAGIWEFMSAGEFNPPLFYWVEHVMLMLGNSEALLRFVPALLGALSVPLFYLIGKEFHDRNTGLIAATACAFSPFLIYYSQEARAYTMMLFFLAAATVFFLRAQKNEGYTDYVLFAICSAIAFYTHFYALVMIAALVIYAMISELPSLRAGISGLNHGNLKRLGAGIVLFVLLSLPLILVTISLFAKRSSSAPTFGIQGLDVISGTFFQVAGFTVIAELVLVILFLVGTVQAFLIDRKKGIFLVTIVLLTFLVSYILSYKIPMQPRYLIFLSIAFFLGVAVSYRFFWSLVRSPATVYGLVALLVVLNIATLGFMGYYTAYTKDDWRGFTAQVKGLAQPGDQIVFVPGYMDQPFNYYYSNASAGTLEYGVYNSTELAGVYALKGNATQYYVLTGDITAANPEGDALAWLKEHAKVVGQNGGIYLLSSG